MTRSTHLCTIVFAQGQVSGASRNRIHETIPPLGPAERLDGLYRQSEGVPLAAATLLLRTAASMRHPTGGVSQPDHGSSAARHAASLLAPTGEEIESMGAFFGRSAADDYTEIGFVAPARIGRHPEIFSDVITAPAFRPADLSKKRATILQLKKPKDAIFNVAYDAFNSLLLARTHPYGRPIDGQSTDRKHFSRQDLTTGTGSISILRRAIFSLIASLPIPQARQKSNGI